MFTDQLNRNQPMDEENPQQKVRSYYGVDLSSYQCYQLKPDPIFSQYPPQDVHFAITAMQKGLKPPTKIGIKRIKRRNYKKKQLIQQQAKKNLPNGSSSPLVNDPNIKPQPTHIPQLNPKSPQQICLKALRRQFRQKIAPNVMEDQNKSVSAKSNRIKKPKRTQQQKNAVRKPKFIRKKQNQLKRRIELITLIRQNYHILRKTRLEVHLPRRNLNKCPRNIGRKQVRQAIAEYYQQKLVKTEQKIKNINDPTHIQKIIEQNNKKHLKRVQRRKRQFQEYQNDHPDQYEDDSKVQQNRLLRRESQSQYDSDSYSSSSRSSEQQYSQTP